MREIIFRGKLTHGKRKGQWAYGSLIQSRQGNITINGLNEDCRVDPETVGQYTGLYDINGKRIFEGDIFLPRKGLFSRWEFDHKMLYIVEFVEGAFAYMELIDRGRRYTAPFRAFYDWEIQIEGNDVEVVGNKWDNKELMEKTE